MHGDVSTQCGWRHDASAQQLEQRDRLRQLSRWAPPVRERVLDRHLELSRRKSMELVSDSLRLEERLHAALAPASDQDVAGLQPRARGHWMQRMHWHAACQSLNDHWRGARGDRSVHAFDGLVNETRCFQKKKPAGILIVQ